MDGHRWFAVIVIVKSASFRVRDCCCNPGTGCGVMEIDMAHLSKISNEALTTPDGNQNREVWRVSWLGRILTLVFDIQMRCP